LLEELTKREGTDSDVKEVIRKVLDVCPSKELGSKGQPVFTMKKLNELAEEFDIGTQQTRLYKPDKKEVLKPYHKLVRHVRDFYKRSLDDFVKGQVIKAGVIDRSSQPSGLKSECLDSDIKKILCPYFCWLFARDILQKYKMPVVDQNDKRLLKQDCESCLEQALAFRVASLLFFQQIQKGSSSMENEWLGNEDVQKFLATQKGLSMRQGMNLQQFFGQWTSDEEVQRKKLALRVYSLFNKPSLEALSFGVAD